MIIAGVVGAYTSVERGDANMKVPVQIENKPSCSCPSLGELVLKAA